jgi:hypothetical protein
MSEQNEVNFVLVPTMTPRELVSLLLTRFPTVRDRVCADEDSFEDPFRVYDRFAEIVRERAGDSQFIESAVRFIDELAESKGSLTREVLMASLLEGIAGDEQFARTISCSISPRAKSLLHQVERSFYLRNPSE